MSEESFQNVKLALRCHSDVIQILHFVHIPTYLPTDTMTYHFTPSHCTRGVVTKESFMNTHHYMWCEYKKYFPQVWGGLPHKVWGHGHILHFAARIHYLSPPQSLLVGGLGNSLNWLLAQHFDIDPRQGVKVFSFSFERLAMPRLLPPPQAQIPGYFTFPLFLLLFFSAPFLATNLHRCSTRGGGAGSGLALSFRSIASGTWSFHDTVNSKGVAKQSVGGNGRQYHLAHTCTRISM